MKIPSLLLLAVALVASACSTRHIPGTQIKDNDDTRAILKVLDEYRNAVEARDAQKVIGLVADTFKDDAGSATPDDDLDYARLREQLPHSLSKVDSVRLEMTVKKIDVQKDNSTARAVFTYTSSFRMPGLTSRPHSDSEIKEMWFKRIGDQWKITSGI